MPVLVERLSGLRTLGARSSWSYSAVASPMAL